MWLAYCCFITKTDERIPLWGGFGLTAQLGSVEYTRPRRFRAMLEQWLTQVRSVWPECPARICPDGRYLRLGPATAALARESAGPGLYVGYGTLYLDRRGGPAFDHGPSSDASPERKSAWRSARRLDPHPDWLRLGCRDQPSQVRVPANACGQRRLRRNTTGRPNWEGSNELPGHDCYALRVLRRREFVRNEDSRLQSDSFPRASSSSPASGNRFAILFSSSISGSLTRNSGGHSESPAPFENAYVHRRRSEGPTAMNISSSLRCRCRKWQRSISMKSPTSPPWTNTFCQLRRLIEYR